LDKNLSVVEEKSLMMTELCSIYGTERLKVAEK